MCECVAHAWKSNVNNKVFFYKNYVLEAYVLYVEKAQTMHVILVFCKQHCELLENTDNWTMTEERTKVTSIAKEKITQA